MSTGWRAIWSRRSRPIRPSAPISACCRGSSTCRQSAPAQVALLQAVPQRRLRHLPGPGRLHAVPAGERDRDGDPRDQLCAARRPARNEGGAHLNWRINRRVNAEDTELITRVQLGMQSPAYVAGPLGTSEVCLRSFAQKLRRLIPEARLEPPPPPGWSRPPNAEMTSGREGPASASAEAPQGRFEPGAANIAKRVGDRDHGEIAACPVACAA